ncbi:helix-turn-helix domain-containing protein [Blautia obeum]|uniref:helix-turn-helix domain-containing protein n=1 Tax=Blautia obeum TaxID=40520 RepID=UPI001B3C6C9E
MRKINRAVKIRIYPNAEQRVQIEKIIGCSRFIYNCIKRRNRRNLRKRNKFLK